MAGTTLVVSIFADDNTTSWTDSDADLMYTTLSDLKMATDWIVSNVARYGCESKFICDWSEHEDLYYQTKLGYTYSNFTDDESMDYYAWEYIDRYIDSAALKANYNADNVIYMVYINSNNSNSSTSCTRTYYEDMDYPYEVCYMFMRTEGERETPSAYAHEMLHTFGAPDLYMAGDSWENFGITEDYVYEMENSYSNDIMFTTYDNYTNEPYYNKITNEFTELDAYYVGITDYSQDVADWGLGSSEH